jgi:hypothetical protein
VSTLELVHHRRHDLPPLWDGASVDWSDWEDTPHSSMVFHAPAPLFACTGCGWIPDTELRAIGRVHPEPGETFTVHKTVPSKRVPGSSWDRKTEVPAWPIARLSVKRCTGCGLDQVTDIETGEVWDLDPSDYTDTGSWPEPEQGALF